MVTNFATRRAESFVDTPGTGPETVVTAIFGDAKAPQTETVTFREVAGKAEKGKEAPTPTIHAFRKGEKGALVISALDFDKAMAVFKELTGSK